MKANTARWAKLQTEQNPCWLQLKESMHGLGELLTILCFSKILRIIALTVKWSNWNSHTFDMSVSEMGLSKFSVGYSRNLNESTHEAKQNSKEILQKSESITHRDQNYAVHRSEKFSRALTRF